MLPSSNSVPSGNQRSHWLILLLIVIAAAALRISPLPHEALSGDEMFSGRVAAETLPSALRDIRDDLVHPPVYYLLLKAGTDVWGESAVGLRVISLFFGLLTLPLLFWLGSKLPQARWSGLLAAACVAVGRWDVFYSQEARSYAFYTALTVTLAIWVGSVSEYKQKAGFWIAGGALMTLLAYTHYVGGVYVAVAILSLLLSRESRQVKLKALGAGFVALLLLLPWLWIEAGVYRSKKGLGDNLDWQGHPGFSDLKDVLANALGVGLFRGATLLSLLVVVMLSTAALVLVSRSQTLRRTPLVMALALMGWLLPVLMFALSNPPVNLSLFAIRHVLPSTVLLLLLCCYGLERLVQTAGKRASFIGLAGAACLFMLSAIPTLQVVHAGASRYPYDQVETAVAAAAKEGEPAYAAWYYGEGEPVNFYCGYACVKPLPEDIDQLPQQFVLLYRPGSGKERKMFQDMVARGYTDAGHTYYTDGLRTQYGTTVVMLERQ